MSSKKRSDHDAGSAPAVKGQSPRTSNEKEAELNRDFDAWVNSALGKKCMGVLRGLVYRPLDENSVADTGRLQHREGARWILAVADARAKLGSEA